MNRWKDFVTFLVPLVALFSACPARADGRVHDLKVVSEQFNPAMPVKSVPGVGLAVASDSATAAIDPTRFWVRIPNDYAGPIHIRLTAVDGRYLSNVVAMVGAGSTAWIPIDLPSNHPEQRAEILEGYRRELLAYAVTAGMSKKHDNDHAETPEEWFLVSEQEPGTERLTTAVLLSSAGAETVSYRLPDSSKRVPCRKIRGHKTRFFDTVCEIGLAEAESLADGKGPKVVNFSRIRGVDLLPAVELRLR